MNWDVLVSELDLRTSRASGAGGQHVNKTASRVELVLNVGESAGLSRREKKNLEFHLGRRLDPRGRLSVVDQSDRSQHTNRKRAEKRLRQLLRAGVRPVPKKHKGKAFTANRKKRLERKKRRGAVKAGRGKVRW